MIQKLRYIANILLFKIQHLRLKIKESNLQFAIFGRFQICILNYDLTKNSLTILYFLFLQLAKSGLRLPMGYIRLPPNPNPPVGHDIVGLDIRMANRRSESQSKVSEILNNMRKNIFLIK